MVHKAILVALALATALVPKSLVADITPDQARESIERGIAYLQRQQNPNGTWPDHPAYSGGITALCTLALLNSGIEPQQESMQKALKYLRGLSPAQTYVVSLQAMVFCAAEPRKDLLHIRRCAKWLEDTQITSGEYKGSWSYPSPAGGNGDPSNSQFAVLALYEAERAGVKVSDKTWRLALQYWQKTQNPDGSWPYRGGPGTGSMTCAGITSLVIASGELNRGDAEVVNGQVQCCGDQQANEAIENGLRWLERNFSVHSNPSGGGGKSSQGNLLYYLYGVERVGRMTARRFIGKHDWYREGADMLVRHQDHLSSFWKGTGNAENNPLIGTSFALLFLSKGRRPVMVAKLKHGPDDDWNRHRSDLANLTSYVEKKWKRDLTWQVIDPAAATVEDLVQAPVLFISGRQAPQFTAEQKKTPARLRRSRRIYPGRGLLRRRRFRTGFSQADERGVSRARIQVAAVAAGASDLACRGIGRSAVSASAVGHRHRLPHERRVLSRGLVVLLGVGTARTTASNCPRPCRPKSRPSTPSAPTSWPTPRIAS